MNTKDNKIFKLKDISEKYDIPVSRLTLAIRQNKLKAVKVGKEYIVTLNEIHRYLGIETTSEGMERELYIKELEGKIKNYEIKINALQSCISMINNVLIEG